MDDCLTCEDGYEILPIYSDCTGLCIKSGDSVAYFTSLGFGDLATSACIANLNCYEGDDLAAMEALPRNGTNDLFADDGSYSYSYSYDVSLACAEEVGFIDCIGAAVLSGEVTQDEVDAAFDAVSGFEDDDWTADTCAEFQQEPNLAEQCGSWTLGQCDVEYKAWVAVWKLSMAWGARYLISMQVGRLHLQHRLRSKRGRLRGGLRRRHRHAVAPVDAAAHGAGIADAPSDGQRLGRRARPHDDARGGSRGRGRVLGASRTRSPSRSHPHPYVSIKNILLRLIGQLGAF